MGTGPGGKGTQRGEWFTGRSKAGGGEAICDLEVGGKNKGCWLESTIRKDRMSGTQRCGRSGGRDGVKRAGGRELKSHGSRLDEGIADSA